jgi:hypothetical protein
MMADHDAAIAAFREASLVLKGIVMECKVLEEDFVRLSR